MTYSQKIPEYDDRSTRKIAAIPLGWDAQVILFRLLKGLRTAAIHEHAQDQLPVRSMPASPSDLATSVSWFQQGVHPPHPEQPNPVVYYEQDITRPSVQETLYILRLRMPPIPDQGSRVVSLAEERILLDMQSELATMEFVR